MTLSQQIRQARAAVNAQTEGTAEFNAACAEVRRLVALQSAQVEALPVVTLLPSYGRKNYRTIPA